MLNWLNTRLKKERLNHRLGSDQDIDAYLAELPSANPQHLLTALDEWLEEPSRLFAELPAGAATHALSRLDEFAQPSIRECWASYFAEGRRDYLADLALKRLDRHFRQTASAYRQAMQASAAEADKSTLTRHAIRAMLALTARKKIGHFSYQGPDAEWWQAAHDLLLQSRNQGTLHLLEAAYEGQEKSSVWREYLIGLLFEVAPLSNLTPPQIDGLDAIVRWTAPHYLCIDSFTPQTPFRIRIDRGDPPMRCAPGQDDDPAWRYFGPGKTSGYLTKLRATISAGRIPEWLPPHCSRKEYLDLLSALLQHWTMAPPKREQTRHAQRGQLLVTRGFALARRMIAASEFCRSGRSLDYNGDQKQLLALRSQLAGHAAVDEVVPKTPLEKLQLLETAGDRQMMDNWEIIDLSAQGLGARFQHRRPWLVIGALLAYRPASEIDWQVGIVRRIGRSHGTPNAGLQIFAGTPQCAQIEFFKSDDDSPWQQQTRDTSGLGRVDAILVSQEAGLLLLPKGAFDADRRAELLIGGKRTPLRLAGIQASGEDYDLVLTQEVAPPPQL
jgi:hypothetical protein